MNENEYLEKLFDERFARDKERLDKDEKLIEELSACNIKLTAMIEAHDKQIASHEKRLEAIEKKPAKRWDSMVEKVLWAVVAAVVAFVLGRIGL